MADEKEKEENVNIKELLEKAKHNFTENARAFVDLDTPNVPEGLHPGSNPSQGMCYPAPECDVLHLPTEVVMVNELEDSKEETFSGNNSGEENTEPKSLHE
ncbi:uncharacterized protein [Periplaneta americana]|uniref:uncharacterized protein n=1 Tax=Periplaneta americana TaxID=6978 RepID=UPI0037E8F2C4